MSGVSATTILKELFADADKIAEAAATAANATCRKGCTHCCTLLVTITAADGLYLAEEILSRPDWKEWTVKIAEAAKQFCYPRITVENWFEKRIPCVFLKDGLCSVYERRPAPCRYHYVLSPVEDCSPDRKDARTKNLDLRQLEDATSWTVSQALGQEYVVGPLPLMTIYGMLGLARLSDEHKNKESKLARLTQNVASPTDWLFKYAFPDKRTAATVREFISKRD